MSQPGDPKFDAETADMVMAMVEDSANTAHQAQSDKDRETALERAFLLQFPVALNERLQGSGIRCDGALSDGEGRGYIVYCKDGGGRPFNATLTFDDYLTAHGRVGADAGREMVELVAKRVYEARAHYFRRMLGV